jgi:pyruvate/2-oxoglutarate dehydrogenase complex dihydrolipoamide dehydrogenase (E3) component
MGNERGRLGGKLDGHNSDKEDGMSQPEHFEIVILGSGQGSMKVLVGASDDHSLGFMMIGSEAGEVMATMQTAMLANLPYPVLRDAVISHLTIAEGLGPLLANIPAR